MNNTPYDKSGIDITFVNEDALEDSLSLSPPLTRSVGVMLPVQQPSSPSVWGVNENVEQENATMSQLLSSSTPLKMHQLPVDKLASPFDKLNQSFNELIFAEVSEVSEFSLLRDLPPFVERYSSFSSASQPRALMAALETSLVAANVDFDVNQQKFSLKCVTYGDNNSVCLFKIRLFKSAGVDELTCEFQRRRGCVLTFRNVYRHVLSQLGSHLKTPAQPSAKSTGCVPLPIPVVDTETPSKEEFARTCMHLLNMASSRFVDVQREASIGLSNLSDSNISSQNLTSGLEAEVLVNGLSRLLHSTESDIVRNAAVFFLNLLSAQSPLFEQHSLQNLMPTVFTVLSSPFSTFNADGKRQLLRGVAVLCQKNPSQNTQAVKPYVNVLDNLRHCSDASIRSSVDTISALISAC
jgi:hypothetical protein